MQSPESEGTARRRRSGRAGRLPVPACPGSLSSPAAEAWHRGKRRRTLKSEKAFSEAYKTPGTLQQCREPALRLAHWWSALDKPSRRVSRRDRQPTRLPDSFFLKVAGGFLFAASGRPPGAPGLHSAPPSQRTLIRFQGVRGTAS